ncbi:MAG: MarR family winged helix-turn-helix transcriptional regulator [Chthoniobacteraceae bacterium]
MPEKTNAPVPMEPKRLPVLLRRAWYGLNQAFRQRVSPLGLTPDQFSILRWLSEGDPQGLTQRSLTDLMASDPNTITSTLSRMESAGLVSRHQHELDRRAHRVCILAAGRRAFEKARKAAQELQQTILADLPMEERDRFLEQLEIIADACSNSTDRTPLKRRMK